MTGLHTDAYLRLVKELAQARSRISMSQYELADLIGVDQSYISKYEGGRQRLDVIEFLRITQAIGCDYREILDQVISGGDL